MPGEFALKVVETGPFSFSFDRARKSDTGDGTDPHHYEPLDFQRKPSEPGG